MKPLIVFFVDHKFYTLFSFLFGVGFAIQLTRAEQRGRDLVSTSARRILILGVIGVLHIALLWYGDIRLPAGRPREAAAPGRQPLAASRPPRIR